MRRNQELPVWLRGLLVGGAALALFVLETRRALRPTRRETQLVHTGRNMVIAGLAGAVMNFIETPFLRFVARRVEANNLGIAPRLTRNPAARVLIAVVLLDYGLYVWHVLTHKVPFLWRFHLVHHVDLDLDSSTAIRFHFGEMLLSVPWRLAQALVAGSNLMAVSIWQTLLLISILFHHSNVRLPLAIERRLRLLIATPRLHGIHHAPERSCLNSNWSSGLSIWDLLHGTHRWREDERKPIWHYDERKVIWHYDEQPLIGVPGYLQPSDVTLRRCLMLPFEEQPVS